jgi:hypothetical protein
MNHDFYRAEEVNGRARADEFGASGYLLVSKYMQNIN